MFLALRIHLTPTAPAVVPAALGRAVYAETLAAIGRQDRALAAALHDEDGLKPLTCSGLTDRAGGLLMEDGRSATTVTLRPGQQLAIRLTGLTEPVSAALSAAFLDRPQPWLELHGARLAVEGAVCDPHRDPWTGQATAHALAEGAARAAGGASRSITLEFASPTGFRSSNMQVPLPLPALVFGSLADRWNAVSGIELDEGVRDFAANAIAVSRFRLESRALPEKNGAVRVGCVGLATYDLLTADPYGVPAANLLSDFALYAGVGSQTAKGMGQCRRVRAAA
jgi:CRISPR-associated endoribonuclease Cas6